VRIDRPVMLDVDAEVSGLEIVNGAELSMDPTASRTLSSTGNVVVRGLLRMHPESHRVNHTLRFAAIDERRFVGGGMTVLDTDVGLWCVDSGRLDLAGSAKSAWARLAAGAPAGARTITLATQVVGWEVGDEIVVSPTVDPTYGGHHDAYDAATIAAISGRTLTLSSGMRHPHPLVNLGNGFTIGAEVMNLTRNVHVEGTADGRAHIFAMSAARHDLAYARLRWLAPRQATGESTYTRAVLGRYALHFHMAGDGTRGTRVTAVVATDCGGHAFVAHESDGIEFTACIAHNTFDEAYWWDGAPDTRTPGSASNSVTYQSCIASRIRTDPPFRGYRLAGFELGGGSLNAVRDCVAVGVQGNKHASGFLWPEGSATGVWDFARCISHNNRANGIFTWQNTSNPHVVKDFACYNNGLAGINHGAYTNGYRYTNGFLVANLGGAIVLHSHSRSNIAQRFDRLLCDSRNLTDHAVIVDRHALVAGQATRFQRCNFVNQRRSAIGFTYDGSNGESTPELTDVVDCSSTTPILWLHESTTPGSRIRVQNGSTALLAVPLSGSGTVRSDWNARTSSTTPVAQSSLAPASTFKVCTQA
jgi:hypothetical protein